MSDYARRLAKRHRVYRMRARSHLLEDRFHIVPYPPRHIRHRSSNALYNSLFHKFFKGECTRKEQRKFRFEGYWIAIQLFGGEAGIIDELRVVAENFEEWCEKNPEKLESFRNEARERGYEYPEMSNIDNTVYADIEKPITVSKEEAKEYFAQHTQPCWIVSRMGHVSQRHRENWPGVGVVWGSNVGVATQSSNIERVRIMMRDEGEDEDGVNEEEGEEGEEQDDEVEDDEAEDDDDEGDEDDGDEGGGDEGDEDDGDEDDEDDEDDDSVSRDPRTVLDLRQRAMNGEITWQKFVQQTEDIAASVLATDDIEEKAPDEHSDDNSSALTSSPLSKAPDEPDVSEPLARLDAGTDINPRKRQLEDADPADGARPPPGPARWAAEFYVEAALDMSRTLSAPARRLAVTKTTHQGETWYVLAWGTQAAGMSAGVARAVQWIFTNHIEGTTRWSGLSLRFILKFSRMGQYAVVGKVAEAPLSQETVNKLASGAHAASLQTPIAAQAKTAAALVSRLMGCGEGTVLQEMMGLSVADLIAEGAAIDDPIVAAILGGDPEEFLGRRSDQVHRAVSPGFIELE